MEAEQQQGQKTVVAFISGLLIGGLLMWVFSAEPKKDNTVEVKTDDTQGAMTEDQSTDTTDTSNVENAAAAAAAAATPKTPEISMANAGISVANQPAGTMVKLGETKYPVDGGWLAVHTLDGDALGPVLGAARFSVSEGLMPTEIELLANTTKGDKYAVVFHTSDGNRTYSSKTDTVMQNDAGAYMGATFMAE